VVTGANSGIGKATASMLASRGGTVVMACRSMERCEGAAADIRNASRAAKRFGPLVPAELDLASLASVRAFASAMAAKLDVLDGLVLNAGFMPTSFRLSKDGLEETFAVNHLGHFELTRQLMDLLAAKKGNATVVSVTSALHTSVFDFLAAPGPGVPLSLEEVNDRARFSSLPTYSMTKLANILFVRELDRRYADRGIVATAVNPGATSSEFLAHTFRNGAMLDSLMDPVYRVVHYFQDSLLWPPLLAALSIAGAAAAPQGHGLYTTPIARVFEPSLRARNHTAARQLWEFSEHLVDQVLVG